MYHAPVPPGDQWALRHLPFYGRWFRFLMTFPGIAMGMEPTGSIPTTRRQRRRDQRRPTRSAGELLSAWMHSVLAERPDLIDKSTPDYPPLGKRVLQDNGSWLRCLMQAQRRAGAHRASSASCPRASSPSTARCTRPTSSATPRDSSTTTSWPPWRSPDATASRCREQWGDEATAYLGITMPNFPNLFCMYGPGTNLAAGASLFYHSEFQSHYAHGRHPPRLVARARTIEVTQEAHDDVRRAVSAGDRRSWCGRTRPSPTATTRTRQGKVYTLSPWPLDNYWYWTRSVDLADYVIT